MNNLMPNQPTLMVYILKALKELGGSGLPTEVHDVIVDELQLPESIVNELVPSGSKRLLSKMSWAKSYLAKEGFVETSDQWVWILTEKGRAIELDENTAREIMRKWNRIYSERRTKTKESEINSATAEEAESEEQGESAEFEAGANLLEVLRGLSPSGFERVCARLLRESGFQNVTVTGRSHDGGIDGEGIVEINQFLTMKVVFQCKRYKGAVSREQVSDFENRAFKTADKGIFITTGYFSSEAVKEARTGGKNLLELIDGEKLVEMFQRAKLGVKPVTIYEVDYEFFRQFED